MANPVLVSRPGDSLNEALAVQGNTLRAQSTAQAVASMTEE
jgi:hypothetical protein